MAANERKKRKRPAGGLVAKAREDMAAGRTHQFKVGESAAAKDFWAGRTQIFNDMDSMIAGLHRHGLRGMAVHILGPIGRLVVTGDRDRPLAVVLPKAYAAIGRELAKRLRGGAVLKHRDGRRLRLATEPFTAHLEAIDTLLRSLTRDLLQLDRGYHLPRRGKRTKSA